jgi:hypothetical protein
VTRTTPASAVDRPPVEAGLAEPLLQCPDVSAEGWSLLRTPQDIALSVIFAFVCYAGPGMFKSFVTLRTGNAWVHAIGYHAIAPHVIVVAKILRIG